LKHLNSLQTFVLAAFEQEFMSELAITSVDGEIERGSRECILFLTPAKSIHINPGQ
jgi:hypothetical protein